MIKRIKKELNLKNLGKLIILSLVLAGNIVLGLYSYKAYKLYTKPTEVIADANHEINIHGAINDLRPQVKRINELVKSGVKEIYIDIASPGGALKVTEAFLRVMRTAKYHGVTFTCTVTKFAASAATIILSECDNRYALYGTIIMWHSLLTQGCGKFNEQSTSKLLNFMKAKNEEIWANTRIHFWPNYFLKHFVNETLLLVSEVEANGFGFVSVIQSYKYKEGQKKLAIVKVNKRKVKKKTVRMRCTCKPVKKEKK